MKRVMKIEGSANKVFEVIKNISQRHPYMTIEEAGEKGLLEPKIQHTLPYELGKFPQVWLYNETENN
jgi:hypothetical protein